MSQPAGEIAASSAADSAIRAWLPSSARNIGVLRGATIERSGPFDAVISYVGSDPEGSLTAALQAVRPGGTLVFVMATGGLARIVRRRALARAFRDRRLSSRRVHFVPSLDRPFLWFDDAAPARVIRHAMGHFGFRWRWKALQAMAFLAREPFADAWAPAQLHIVVAPVAVS